MPFLKTNQQSWSPKNTEALCGNGPHTNLGTCVHSRRQQCCQCCTTPDKNYQETTRC